MEQVSLGRRLSGAGQGQWHKLFGHPRDYVKLRRHAASSDGELARFFCCECRRHFWKRIERK